MTLIGAILLIVIIGTVKSLSFAAWQFRKKNYIGGIAMIILSLVALASSYVIL